MTAVDEFPRGWSPTIEQDLTGIAAQIIIPAVPGVTHVLTSIQAHLVDATVAPGASEGLVVQAFDGVSLLLSWLLWIASLPGSDDFQWTGSLAGTVGNSMTIEFAPPTPGHQINQDLSAEGYDY